MAKIGYMRVSTEDQRTDLQEQALVRAGVDVIYSDVISGTRTSRDGLDKAIAALKKGDTLVVWKLDRLGRTILHLKRLVEELQAGGIGLQSLQEEINTSTAVGKMFFHLLCVFAEFERDLTSERTKAGLAAARGNGKVLGRRPDVDYYRPDIERMLEIKSVRDVVKETGLSHSTVARISSGRAICG